MCNREHSINTFSGCWHCQDRPCPEWVDCQTLGPRCGGGDSDKAETRARAAGFRRETLARPVIFVGTGTCGLGAGAAKTVEAARRWLQANGQTADLVEVGCVGMCSVEPILDVQLPGRARLCFHSAEEARVPGILDSVFAGNPAPEFILGQYQTAGAAQWENVPQLSEHPFFALQHRQVLANCGVIDPGDLREYLASGGYRAFAGMVRTSTPDEVCRQVEASGLRGRGGGGFPTGKKWSLARATASEQKYLICNADEGDPGAFMDRAVIESDPHRLLEGMAIAAYAIGASKAYVYIRAEYPLAIRRLQEAIREAEAVGLLGTNILDSGMNLRIVLKKGAGAFVCGEETALMHSVEGKRGMPRPRPPYPASSGLFGKPTVINNVETLANLPGLLAMGASGFAAAGTAGSKGTKVFALSGKVERTGLVEVTMGTSLRQIIFDIGGGIPGGKAFKAVQIGGPSGGCIPESHLDIDIDYESLKTVGAMMGSGGLVVMDEDTCMVDVARYFMDFIQRESCGKCIPCREGTRRMLQILESITRARGRETQQEALERFQGVLQLEELSKVIQATSLCGLGQSAPNPVLSTLRWFRSEYEAHIYERRCPAGACTEFRRFHIDVEKCNGCTACARQCPSAAIVGAKKQAHYIVEDKCIGCGACMETCRFGAISLE